MRLIPAAALTFMMIILACFGPFLPGLVLAAPSDAPAAQTRHHKADSLPKWIEELNLVLIGYGEIIVDLQRRVEKLEQHKCQCPAKPLREWRPVNEVPGLFYYGYERDGIFHVEAQRYTGPPVIRR